MLYKSTRGGDMKLTASQAILKGISEDGGLFVPESFPDVSGELEAMCGLSYNELAKRIFSLFLTDFSHEEITGCVDSAYTAEKFGGDVPVRIKKLSASRYMLELWHGPTCAFKDMALQALPHLMTASMKKRGDGRGIVILTATSGDTGKAALEGFKNVPGTEIMVFYPRNGVSAMQELQMTTQEGDNVRVCAVKGNFDDAQTEVKRVFTDKPICEKLNTAGKAFSSANSINWGRLLPQLVYYFYAYFELVRTGETALGDRVNIAVPTGNFGNILAAYYAENMGLPVGKLICASNKNRVLADFINSSVYDRRREFYATASPSMDILVSSNLERLLYHLSGGSSERLCGWMDALKTKGAYMVDDAVLEKLRERFYGGYCTEDDTAAWIKRLMDDDGYLCDTHTAVAVSVTDGYRRNTGDCAPVIIASTADPYKFPEAVLSALGEDAPEDPFEAMARLEKFSGVKAPARLSELSGKPVRFTDAIDKYEAGEYVLSAVGTGGK